MVADKLLNNEDVHYMFEALDAFGLGLQIGRRSGGQRPRM
jgi:hypothetical protein